MPTKYLDEEGLSHVVRRAKETFADKKELWNWQKTEKAGAVAFEPVPDSVLEPVVEFKFKETLPAEGEKGPDNPSTIEGINIVSIVHGSKNYVTLPYHTPTRTWYGVEWTVNNDNTVTASGKATEISPFYFTGHETNQLHLVPGRKYYLRGCPSGGSLATYHLGVNCGVDSTYSVAYDYGEGVVFEPKVSDDVIVSAVVNNGITVENITFKPQLEDGETGTVYDLVQREKVIVSLGNTYYGGNVNLATGVMTLTHFCHIFDGTENAYYETTSYTNTSRINCSNNGFPEPSEIVTKANDVAYCTHYQHKYDWQDRVAFAVHWNGVPRFFTPVSIASTAEELKSFFAHEYAAGHPVTIVYEVKNPTTVQLTPQQILSLSSLDKYEPRINTVYTDAESIQVGYQKFTASEKGINGISLRETSSTVRNEIHPVNPIEWGMAYDLYNGSYCLRGDIDFYDASGNEIAPSTGYTVSEPNTQSVTINFPNAVPKTINGYIAMCQGNCDGWSSISFDNVSIEDILNAGVDGLFIQGGFLFSDWGGPYPYPNDTDAVVYMTDNGNGSYTMKFATCTSSEATYPYLECRIENADGTEESLNLDILYNHVGGQIVDDTNTYLPLWVDQSETPTLPIFDLYQMMSFGFADSNSNQIPFNSYSYASDGKSVIVDFGNNPFPTKIMSMVSYFTEESLSNEEVESMYAIGIETTSMGRWNPVSISLDEAFGMSNGILLHEYSYYDDPPVLLSNNTISLLVERVSETAIKLSVVQPNENGSIKLHLESASTNNIDLAPLARKTVSSISLKTQVLQPQMHSNDDANSYDIFIEFYDKNGVYLNGNSLNKNDFTYDNIQTQIDPSAEYIKIEYTEYYSGHLCVEYSTDLISISELKKGKFLPSHEANRYYAI